MAALPQPSGKEPLMTRFHDIPAAHNAGSHWLPVDDNPDIGRLCFEEGVVIDTRPEDDECSERLGLETPCIVEA
jgi:hypothetical protein